jgi:hypothetical protein
MRHGKLTDRTPLAQANVHMMIQRRTGRPNWALRKPVAIPERNAIQFRNAQTQQIGPMAPRCYIERLCAPSVETRENADRGFGTALGVYCAIGCATIIF